MNKKVFCLLLCIMFMHIFFPKTFAESINISGVCIDVPSDKDFEVISDETIRIYLDSIRSTQISVKSLDSLGLDSESFSVIGEDVLLDYILSQYVKMYPQCENKITTLANRKCCVIITIIEQDDIEFNYGRAATFIGEQLVEFIYLGLKNFAEQDVVLDICDFEMIMSWISEEVQDNAFSSIELPKEDHIGQIKEYEMNKGTFILRLDENNCNIFTENNEENSLSLSRTGFTKSQMDLYVDLSNLELFILPIGANDTKFSVNVRVKENKYPEIDSFLSLSESEWNILASSLVTSFSESEYETVEKDSVRYCVFDCFSGLSYQKRYATVHNGSMIYIYASRDGEELTEEDIRFLEEIVDSAQYN